MTASYRPLRLESCEDRALPSTLISFNHTDWPVASFASAADVNVFAGRSSREFGRDSLEALARAFRGQDFQNFIARSFENTFARSGGYAVFVFVYVSSKETDSPPVTHEAPAQERLPPRQFSSAGEGGSDRVPTDPGKAINVSPPAIAIPPLANADGANLPTDTNASSSPAFPPQIDSQSRITISGNAKSAGLGGPLVFLGVDPTETPPADEPPPSIPLAVLPTVPVIDEAPATAISVADFANSAVAGALPFNLAALEAGARDILSRVGNLDVELPDSFGGSGEYWWLATAALVAGGVATSVRGNRARWADRRTVGFDSVLAKWGERNGGRFD
jgi:hypothetical protein